MKTRQETLQNDRVIEVVNMSKCKDFGTREGDVRIDRRTKWGNPYHISKTCSRQKSIELYEFHFIFGLLKDIDELKNAKRLGCWCAPLACHGDVIKRYLTKCGL